MKGGGRFQAPYRQPPDLTTLSKRYGGKFPEAYVSRVLRNGVVIPAHGPPEMPVWATTTTLDKVKFEVWIKDLASFLSHAKPNNRGQA